jgi:hypothetical protein
VLLALSTAKDYPTDCNGAMYADSGERNACCCSITPSMVGGSDHCTRQDRRCPCRAMKLLLNILVPSEARPERSERQCVCAAVSVLFALSFHGWGKKVTSVITFTSLFGLAEDYGPDPLPSCVLE